MDSGLPSWAPLIAFIIAGVLLLAAARMAIFAARMPEAANEDASVPSTALQSVLNQKVVSYNQSGGIIVHTIRGGQGRG